MIDGIEYKFLWFVWYLDDKGCKSMLNINKEFVYLYNIFFVWKFYNGF